MLKFKTLKYDNALKHLPKMAEGTQYYGGVPPPTFPGKTDMCKKY
jgi:hypothetical protein